MCLFHSFSLKDARRESDRAELVFTLGLRSEVSAWSGVGGVDMAEQSSSNMMRVL